MVSSRLCKNEGIGEGEDATEAVEAMVSLVRDKLNADGHELDNGQARD